MDRVILTYSTLVLLPRGWHIFSGRPRAAVEDGQHYADLCSYCRQWTNHIEIFVSTLNGLRLSIFWDSISVFIYFFYSSLNLKTISYSFLLLSMKSASNIVLFLICCCNFQGGERLICNLVRNILMQNTSRIWVERLICFLLSPWMRFCALNSCFWSPSSFLSFPASEHPIWKLRTSEKWDL